ncbi:MAG: nuclear transport factor 2 family protein [Chloroflexi bacterium HGW-Chloroflexi-3]|nr:MAG: nuclear transport factor 2 family protein [Chloroflexi bacterium HGW-Chloroflexi-3]
MTPTRLFRIEATTRIVLKFNNAFNRHNVLEMMQLMSDDCVFENTNPPPDGMIYSGKDEVTQFWHKFFLDSPHAYIEIEEIYGLGMHCVIRWKYYWIDANGDKGHVRGGDFFKVKNGLISEKLSYVKG